MLVVIDTETQNENALLNHKDKGTSCCGSNETTAIGFAKSKPGHAMDQSLPEYFNYSAFKKEKGKGSDVRACKEQPSLGVEYGIRHQNRSIANDETVMMSVEATGYAEDAQMEENEHNMVPKEDESGEEEGEEDEDEGEDEEGYCDDMIDGGIEGSQGEIDELKKLIPGLSDQYRLLGKIGEGTFSTVYKAIDLQHDKYDNRNWDIIFDTNTTENRDIWRRSRVVAIKKIYVTSSPVRISNEISILNDLRGCKYIVPLITAIRREDQVVVVLPYFSNDDFRRFYLDLPINEIRWYFTSLFNALMFTHSKKIMHRDIKPSNFLYDVQRRHGVLVDFGLAERADNQEAARYKSRRGLKIDSETATRIFRSFDAKGRPGVPRQDTRPGLRANRAGTRGFRAPEVLLKIPYQSVAIDMWSAGVILLCFLTRRFPFFQSTDDTEALLEIGVLFGRLEMERVAAELGRTFMTNIPTVKDRGIRFESLVKAYNTDGYPYIPPEAFDLLRKCLTLNPSERISASDALQHPFVTSRGSSADTV